MQVQQFLMSKDSELLPEWQVKHKLSFFLQKKDQDDCLLSHTTQVFSQLTFQGHVCRWIAQVTAASLALCHAAGNRAQDSPGKTKLVKEGAEVTRGIFLLENPHPSKPGYFWVGKKASFHLIKGLKNQRVLVMLLILHNSTEDASQSQTPLLPVQPADKQSILQLQAWFDLLWPYGLGGEEEDGDREHSSSQPAHPLQHRTAPEPSP